ncbi:MAG: glycosyltransferase family 2 protein [Actinobacteria bacterium]|nr:MAG: glycosyltransferase family 2 protein [Actinomycetota bacterium]
MPEVSVVLSVYNGERFVREALESAFAQDFGDVEFVVVDNGSADGTAGVLRELAEAEPRMTVISLAENVGMSNGRRRAIEASTGAWIAMLDHDDVWEPGKLSAQMRVANDPEVHPSVVGTWAEYTGDDGRSLGARRMEPISVARFRELYEAGEAIVLVHASALIRRSDYDAVGGYRAECDPADDLDLWYRMAETGHPIVVVPEQLVRYRIHGSAESVTKTLLQRRKTHFIHYNMRRRRAGEPEVSWEAFDSRIWADRSYRRSRLRNDYAISLYKQAGLHFALRHYVRAAAYVIATLFVRPSVALRRLASQRTNIGADGLR